MPRGRGGEDNISTASVPRRVEPHLRPGGYVALAQHPEPAKGQADLYGWCQWAQVIGQRTQLVKQARQDGESIEWWRPHGEVGRP